MEPSAAKARNTLRRDVKKYVKNNPLVTAAQVANVYVKKGGMIDGTSILGDPADEIMRDLLRKIIESMAEDAIEEAGRSS